MLQTETMAFTASIAICLTGGNASLHGEDGHQHVISKNNTDRLEYFIPPSPLYLWKHKVSGAHQQQNVMEIRMHKFGKIILATGMLSLLSVIPLAAQVDNGVVFKAPIPFYAGNVKWPAGSYIVTQPNPNEWNLVLRNIAGTKGEIINFIPSSSLNPQKASKVIFQKYGNTGYLQTLLVEGETEEIEFPLAKAKAKANTMARNTNKDTKVVEQATLVSRK